MKIRGKVLILFFCLTVLSSKYTEAQLQFANLSGAGSDDTSIIPRISWKLSLYEDFIPLGETFGLFTQTGFNNTGFIYNAGDDRFKHRNIALGTQIGAGVRLGKTVLFAGYKLELNFHYKSKIFRNQERSQKEVLQSEWFSDRVNLLGHSIQAGVALPNGVIISGGYYLNNFFNQDFTETISGVEIKPFEDFTANRFEIGIGLTTTAVKRIFGSGE